MHKSYALALIAILAISSLIMVKPSYASTPTLSPPEFTLKLVDNSYDVPAKTTIDPYTGENITHPGSHVENKTIVLSIKNQLYDQDHLFLYGVRTKGHFEEAWRDLYVCPESFDDSAWGVGFRPLGASDSEYTVVSFPANYPSNAQIDFQVKAALYNISRIDVRYNLRTLILASDWSITKTILISDNSTLAGSSPSATLNPSENPTVAPDQSGPQTVTFLGLDWLQFAMVVLLVVIAVLLVVLVIFLHKQRGT